MTEQLTLKIDKLNKELKRYQFGNEPQELYEPISYLLDIGGKRMRPILALLAYQLYREESDAIITPALSIEVFHNFTLMHDDIMDKAPLRRGFATVHEKWNSNLAILSGDVMLIKAYEMLAKVEAKYLGEALRLFNKVATEVCEGQQMDMNFENRNAVPIEEYIEMIRLKTAVLLGFSLRLGGLLAGASVGDQESLQQIGENIGIGFQLKDDLLDVYGDQAKFGKQVGGDIIANKKTFLLLTALQKANAVQLVELNSLLNNSSEDKVIRMTAVYDEIQVRRITEEQISLYFSRGFEQLNKLQIEESKRQNLASFFHWLIQRES